MEPINVLKQNKNKIIKKTRKNLNKYQINGISSKILPLTKKSINKYLKKGGSYSPIGYNSLVGTNYDIKEISQRKSENSDAFNERCQTDCNKDSECIGFLINSNTKGQDIATLKKERGIALIDDNDFKYLDCNVSMSSDDFNKEIEEFLIKHPDFVEVGREKFSKKYDKFHGIRQKCIFKKKIFYFKESPLIFEIIKILELLFFKDVMQDEQFSEYTKEIKSGHNKEEQFEALKKMFINLSKMDNVYFDKINDQLKPDKEIIFNHATNIMEYLVSYAIILISFIFNDLFTEDKLNKLTIDNLKKISQLYLDRGNEIKNIFRFLHSYVSSYKFILDNPKIITIADKQIFSFTQDKELLKKLITINGHGVQTKDKIKVQGKLESELPKAKLALTKNKYENYSLALDKVIDEQIFQKSAKISQHLDILLTNDLRIGHLLFPILYPQLGSELQQKYNQVFKFRQFDQFITKENLDNISELGSFVYDFIPLLTQNINLKYKGDQIKYLIDKLQHANLVKVYGTVWEEITEEENKNYNEVENENEDLIILLKDKLKKKKNSQFLVLSEYNHDDVAEAVSKLQQQSTKITIPSNYFLLPDIIYNPQLLDQYFLLNSTKEENKKLLINIFVDYRQNLGKVDLKGRGLFASTFRNNKSTTKYAIQYNPKKAAIVIIFPKLQNSVLVVRENSQKFWMLPEIDFTEQINKEKVLTEINTITGLNLEDKDINYYQDIYIDNQKTTMFKSFETKYLLIVKVDLDYENVKTKINNSPYFYKKLDQKNPEYDYVGIRHLKNNTEDCYELLSKKNSNSEYEFISVPYFIINRQLYDYPITKFDYWGESRNHSKSTLEINTESFHTIGLYVLQLEENKKRKLIGLSTKLFNNINKQDIDVNEQRIIINLEKEDKLNQDFIDFIEKQHITSNITQNITEVIKNNTSKLINENSQPENEKLMTVSDIQSDQKIKYRYTQNCLFLLSKMIEYLNEKSNIETNKILKEEMNSLLSSMMNSLCNSDSYLENIGNLNQSQLIHFYFALIYYFNISIINPDLLKKNEIEDIFNQTNNYEKKIMDKLKLSNIDIDYFNQQLEGLKTDQEIITKIKDQLSDQSEKIQWLFQNSEESATFDGIGSLFPDQDKTYYLELQDEEGIYRYYRTVKPLKLISEDSSKCLINITHLIDTPRLFKNILKQYNKEVSKMNKVLLNNDNLDKFNCNDERLLSFHHCQQFFSEKSNILSFKVTTKSKMKGIFFVLSSLRLIFKTISRVYDMFKDPESNLNFSYFYKLIIYYLFSSETNLLNNSISDKIFTYLNEYLKNRNSDSSLNTYYNMILNIRKSSYNHKLHYYNLLKEFEPIINDLVKSIIYDGDKEQGKILIEQFDSLGIIIKDLNNFFESIIGLEYDNDIDMMPIKYHKSLMSFLNIRFNNLISTCWFINILLSNIDYYDYLFKVFNLDYLFETLDLNLGYNLKLNRQQLNKLWNNNLDEQLGNIWMKVEKKDLVENQKLVVDILKNRTFLSTMENNKKKLSFLQLVDLIYHQHSDTKETINLIELIKDNKALVSFKDNLIQHIESDHIIVLNYPFLENYDTTLDIDSFTQFQEYIEMVEFRTNSNDPKSLLIKIEINFEFKAEEILTSINEDKSDNLLNSYNHLFKVITQKDKLITDIDIIINKFCSYHNIYLHIIDKSETKTKYHNFQLKTDYFKPISYKEEYVSTILGIKSIDDYIDICQQSADEQAKNNPEKYLFQIEKSKLEQFNIRNKFIFDPQIYQPDIYRIIDYNQDKYLLFVNDNWINHMGPIDSSMSQKLSFDTINLFKLNLFLKIKKNDKFNIFEELRNRYGVTVKVDILMFESGTILNTKIIQEIYQIKLINIEDKKLKLNIKEFKECLEPKQDKLLERFKDSSKPKKYKNMEIFFSIYYIDYESIYLSNLENVINAFKSNILYIYRPYIYRSYIYRSYITDTYYYRYLFSNSDHISLLDIELINTLSTIKIRDTNVDEKLFESKSGVQNDFIRAKMFILLKKFNKYIFDMIFKEKAIGSRKSYFDQVIENFSNIESTIEPSEDYCQKNKQLIERCQLISQLNHFSFYYSCIFSNESLIFKPLKLSQNNYLPNYSQSQLAILITKEINYYIEQNLSQFCFQFKERYDPSKNLSIMIRYLEPDFANLNMNLKRQREAFKEYLDILQKKIHIIKSLQEKSIILYCIEDGLDDQISTGYPISSHQVNLDILIRYPQFLYYLLKSDNTRIYIFDGLINEPLETIFQV